ncbi:MAG: ABC transporter ATP-binding protein [Clostridiales Family XIII bacterium]|jgi:branched-chain amino acid transport system ATP-binding protein|nr:ABC transporter ATP-binding protein [Clostridiales Family XIII bacterium]
MKYKSVVAVDNLSFAVEKGSICGLIGTNGAGKSTVVNMISGSSKPTSGEIIFKGARLDKLSPDRIAGLGVARTFQNLRIFGKLSALDNVRIAAQARHSYNFAQMALGTPHYRSQERAITESAQRILHRMGIGHYAEAEAGSLPYGHQRRLEIARCLALEPELLLLDEPAAGMNPNESVSLARDIRRVREETGTTILLIEHDMSVVMSLCEYIYVMDFGILIGEGDPDTIRRDPEVIRAYLGAEREYA